MAYVPPHKRLSKEDKPTTPELLAPQISKKLNIHSSRPPYGKKGDSHNSIKKNIIYADHCISRWLVVPVADDGQLPPSVHLASVSLDSIGRKTGEKPLTLVDDHSNREHKDGKSFPWRMVVANTLSDLFSSYQHAQNEIKNEGLEKIKPQVVARFGKLLFKRKSSFNLESLKELPISETSLSDLERSFFTNIPVSYMDHIRNGTVSKIGLNFEEEKELYHVKLADAMRSKSTIISCKCRVLKGEKKLELYKIELNPVRHLIVDISCVDSNVDLRLALYTKRIISVLTDEEKQSIRDLVHSAILDQNLKGGLKWPLGVANSGSRFSVVGVWHTKAETYRNPFLRLKMREADRYDFLSSTGEVTREVTLKLPGITKTLSEELGKESVSIMLEDTLKLIWENFLSWDGKLVTFCES